MASCQPFTSRGWPLGRSLCCQPSWIPSMLVERRQRSALPLTWHKQRHKYQPALAAAECWCCCSARYCFWCVFYFFYWQLAAARQSILFVCEDPAAVDDPIGKYCRRLKVPSWLMALFSWVVTFYQQANYTWYMTKCSRGTLLFSPSCSVCRFLQSGLQQLAVICISTVTGLCPHMGLVADRCVICLRKGCDMCFAILL